MPRFAGLACLWVRRSPLSLHWKTSLEDFVGHAVRSWTDFLSCLCSHAVRSSEGSCCRLLVFVGQPDLSRPSLVFVGHPDLSRLGWRRDAKTS